MPASFKTPGHRSYDSYRPSSFLKGIGRLCDHQYSHGSQNNEAGRNPTLSADESISSCKKKDFGDRMPPENITAAKELRPRATPNFFPVFDKKFRFRSSKSGL
jgi:hypothetical protein